MRFEHLHSKRVGYTLVSELMRRCCILSTQQIKDSLQVIKNIFISVSACNNLKQIS